MVSKGGGMSKDISLKFTDFLPKKNFLIIILFPLFLF